MSGSRSSTQQSLRCSQAAAAAASRTPDSCLCVPLMPCHGVPRAGACPSWCMHAAFTSPVE